MDRLRITSVFLMIVFLSITVELEYLAGFNDSEDLVDGTIQYDPLHISLFGTTSSLLAKTSLIFKYVLSLDQDYHCLLS